MAGDRIREEQSTQTNNVKKGKRRGKLRLKKSVRRTAGALLLTTSLIVAAIPVQDAKALSSDQGAGHEGEIPDLDAICISDLSASPQQYFHVADTSVPGLVESIPSGDPGTWKNVDSSATPNTGVKIQYAFPYKGLRYTKDDLTKKYLEIDMTNMRPSGEGTAVPIYELSKSPTSGGEYTNLFKYIGDSANVYVENNTINLGTSVVYNMDNNVTAAPAYIVFPVSDPTHFYRYVESKESRSNEHVSSINYMKVVEETYEFNKYLDSDGNEQIYSKLNLTEGTDPDTCDILIDSEGNRTLQILDNTNPKFTQTAQDVFFACTNEVSQPIATIGNEAFKDIGNVKTIEIPDVIKQIGDSAFENCSILENAKIYNGCSKIGTKCFANCSRLSNLEMEDGLEYIGDGAFANCISLSSTSLPAGIKQVGSAAFYGCTAFNDQTASLGSPTLFSRVTAADGPVIGDYMFAKCENLSDIWFSDNVTQIGNLNTDPFPDTGHPTGSVYSGFGTFAGCTNLKHVDLPKNWGTRPQYVLNKETFSGCNQLEWVRFPNKKGQPYPGDFDYDDGGAFKSHFAIWGDGLGSDNKAFVYAIKNNLSYMYESGGVIKYVLICNGYQMVFDEYGNISDCIPVTGMESEGIKPESRIEIKPRIGNIDIVSIGKDESDMGAFQNLVANVDGKTYPEEISIPSTVTSICDDAFKSCGNLKKVEITTSGVDIGAGAFSENNSLEDVSFKQVEGTAGDTNLGDRCFYKCPKLKYLNLIDDDMHGNSYDYIHINNIGNEAFYTQGESLTIKGPMLQGYGPYEFAIAGNSINSRTDGYITYTSGNPYNLTCKYDSSLNGGTGGVALLEYPNVTTDITGFTLDEFGNKTSVPETLSIHDMILRKESDYQPRYNMQDWIVDATENMVIPYGITNIEKAKTVMDASSHKYTDAGGAEHNLPATYDREFVMFEDLIDPWYEVGCCQGNGPHGTENIEFVDVKEVPDDCFKDNVVLRSVTFDSDITDLGNLPFYVDNCTGEADGLALPSRVVAVNFLGDAASEAGTPENPKYWCDNGLIFSNDGSATTLEECLPGRGNVVGDAKIVASETEDVRYIKEKALQNCDYITSLDLSTANNLKQISTQAAYDCDKLKEVNLPETRVSIYEEAFASDDTTNPKTVALTVTLPAQEYDIADNAFDNVEDITFVSLEDSAAESYAKRHKNISFEVINGKVLVKFIDYNGKIINTQRVEKGYIADPPADPVREGYTFTGWSSGDDTVKVTSKLFEDTTFIAQYTDIPSSSSSSSSTTPSKTTPTKPSGSTSPSSKSSSSTSKSSSSSSSSTSTSISHPIILSGQTAAPYIGAGATASKGNGGSASNSSPSSSKPSSGSGKTSVISTAGGITDVGKMSATVNGSSDNYVVKITQTQEANDMAAKALQGAFGDLEPIRYLPFDISLYDSTGTNKISPIPDGVSISITMPIPDDLAIYGGNAKVASTVDGTLEKIQPRFTVINSVPCMTYTVTHLSPYVVYVDTANLTEAGIADATPKTADPIHPKWFLCIGLAAAAIVLFIKKDPEEYMRKVKNA